MIPRRRGGPDGRGPGGVVIGGDYQGLGIARTRLGRSRWVLYPTRDETVAAVAANRDALLPHFRVPTPGLPSVSRAWDKRETYRLADQLRIPIPRTWFPRAETDLAAIGLAAPVVVKPGEP